MKTNLFIKLIIPRSGKEEVKKVIHETLDEFKKFEILIQKINKETKSLPKVVLEATYYHYSHGTFRLNGLSDPFLCQNVESAAEEGYLSIDERDGIVSLETSDPKIQQVLKLISDLRIFLDKAKEEFYIDVIERYNFNPELKNRRFWTTFLNL